MASHEIIRVTSISQMLEGLNCPPPEHPLVSVVNVSDIKIPKEMEGQRVAVDLYCVALKDSDCGMVYGRKSFDFSEGVLIFYEPGQVMAASQEMNEGLNSGWMLFFHPDLIRKTHLGSKIHTYSFFSYDTYEALHLSDREQQLLGDCVEKIKYEYSQNIDAHSRDLIVSNIEMILNYSNRFYERQFHTRTASNQGVVSQFNQLLQAYFESGEIEEKGIPTVSYFSERIHLSANYLSDLLKKETGKNFKDHVNTALVDRAKSLLLGSEYTVSEISYKLGFNYPHYFSRMFKLQTGMTPNKYRLLN
ncbi:AraC family transcriptional regulator [bacterium SCSIO 12741]|nr:AraC family transcriptional regulator [bacterium SCSIO 12741]